jgi:SAM-dependent methyltransferase
MKIFLRATPCESRTMAVIAKFRRSLARRGLVGTVSAATRYAGFRGSRIREHAWDWRHGTDTAQQVEPPPCETGAYNLRFAKRYEAITPAFFQRMIEVLPLGDGAGQLPPARSVFVDLGSGKGRALLLASRLPFRELHGVEISPRLHEIAQQNVLRFCGPAGAARFRLRCADAADFRFPPLPTVMFLYNPFGAPVMRQVIGNLVTSVRERPRPCFVLYRNPVCAALFTRDPGFRVVEANPDYAVYAAVAGH